MKKVLILAYRIPPMGGVGTRRWTKFAKYLHRAGYEVHLLGADYPYVDENSWAYDLPEGIRIHRYRSRYPAWLLHDAPGTWKRKLKRYLNFFLKRTFFPIDIAQHDAAPLLKAAKKILREHGIRHVVATGHPVSVNYLGTYLKIDDPGLTLIQDFRDNWNDLEAYGFGNPGGLPFFRQKEASAYREFFTLFYADRVLNVSEDLTRRSLTKHRSLGEKFVTLTNGYDPEDFRGIESDSSRFDMIYTGSLFNRRIEALELLMEAILELDDPWINEHFRLDLYTNYDPARLKGRYGTLLERNIFFHPMVAPREVLHRIAAHYCTLSINARFAPYAYGTKIFDYMALGKPILHISEGGSLSGYLEAKGQYVCGYSTERMKALLLRLKADYLAQERVSRPDYSEFSLEHLTGKLIRLLEEGAAE